MVSRADSNHSAEPSVASLMADGDGDGDGDVDGDSEGDADIPANVSTSRVLPSLSQVDNRNIPLKQLLARRGRRRGLELMPSTVKRLEERKKRRRDARLQAKQVRNDAMASEDDPIPGNRVAMDQPSVTVPGTDAPLTEVIPTPDPSPSTHISNPRTTSDSPGFNRVDQAIATDGNGNEDDVVAPQVTLDADGNIVIDQSSLYVAANTVADDEDRVMNTVELHSTNNHITSASFAKRESSIKWGEAETKLFYDGLRTFGTDFTLMARLFPNRSRRQLKLKFKREERSFPARIEEALSAPRLPIPLDLLKVPSNDVITEKAPEEAANVVPDENVRQTGRDSGTTCDVNENENAAGEEVVGRVSDDEDEDGSREDDHDLAVLDDNGIDLLPDSSPVYGDDSDSDGD